ncbi:MAG: glutamyl-tRNA reductase [bacterium]|nr:glutamyl-tRNA reductase [bacterium]
MNFGIIGTSIWQQNMPLLERLTIDRQVRPAEVARLKQVLGVDELVYLATCNRVEFLYASSKKVTPGKLLHRLIDYFFRSEREISFFPNDFYHFTGREAILHLFRTAASLESLVVGETQITGQLKQAHQDALEYGVAGTVTSGLINEALVVAKRVKRETNLGVGALSMASLAASELQERLNGIDTPLVAIVGAGPMTQKIAKYLNEHLVGRLLFVNRTVAKAEALAEEFGGQAMSFEQFVATPGPVNAIISATSATEAVFDSAFLNRLSDSGTPVVCIDLAVPRDFSAEFSSDPRVTLIDIPHLKSRGNGNLRQKFVEAGKANEIVRDAVNQYLADRVELTLKPIFHDSYQESLELANRALEDLFTTKLASLDDSGREAVKRLVTKLIGHSSFQPVKILSDRLAATQTELTITELTSTRKEAV